MLAILIGLALAQGPVQALQAVVLLETGPSICAGVLIDEQGTVATAYHCVASGRRPRVSTRSGKEGIGRMVATDPENDLALVQVDALAGQPSIPFRNMPAVQGMEVWALGHPFGSQQETGRGLKGTLQWSMSRGVVSAVGDYLIQTDAALNPGNSGGPLVDDQGQLVGIASRKLRGDNVAFVVPAREVAELALVREKARLTGGQGAVYVSGYLPSLNGYSGTLGLTGQLSLRDTLLVSGAVHLPVGYRWQSIETGTASWVNAELMMGARARAFRGRWSTTLDVNGGLVYVTRDVASVVDGQVQRGRVWPAPFPAASVRLGVGGSALKWTVLYDQQPVVLFGLEVDFPGVVAAF